MNQKKILVVEDEVIFGIDLIEKLKNSDYLPYPKAIRYAEEVLETAQKYKPDLIIMDIHLKGEMNGIQAALLVQDNLKIPVVFLTAFSDQETLEIVKTAGPYALLRKPVKHADLQIAIEIGLHREKIEKQLKEKIIELQEALDSIQFLKGFIQMCAHCRNIQDETGCWDNLENYIKNHTGTVFSHGICPTCMDECYGDEDWYIKALNLIQQEKESRK